MGALDLKSSASGRRQELWCLARMRRTVGRQALPRSNSTGHKRAGGVERFALWLPEHVRLEILMSHRLGHVTSAVASVRIREGSAHDVGVGSNVWSAVARLLSLFLPGTGWKGDDEDKSGKVNGPASSAEDRIGVAASTPRKIYNRRPLRERRSVLPG